MKKQDSTKPHLACSLLGWVLLPTILATPAQAQFVTAQNAYLPASNLENPSERGPRFHTNYRIMLTPQGGLGPGGGMTPAQVRSFYNLPTTGGFVGGAAAACMSHGRPTRTASSSSK